METDRCVVNQSFFLCKVHADCTIAERERETTMQSTTVIAAVCCYTIGGRGRRSALIVL